MNVWIRISSRMDIESDIDPESATHLQVNAGLNLTVYATKEHAKRAQQQAGGIILEIDATCLADVEGEFGKEVILSSDAQNEGSQSSSAYIDVCFDGLPYTWVPNYGPYEPGTAEPQGEIAEFGPEAEAWLKKLGEVTGFSLHQ